MYRLFDFMIIALFITIQILIYASISSYLHDNNNDNDIFLIENTGVKVKHFYYFYLFYSILSPFLLNTHPFFFYLSTILNIIFIAITFSIISKAPKSLNREILFITAIITSILYSLLFLYYIATTLS